MFLNKLIFDDLTKFSLGNCDDHNIFMSLF